MLSGGREGHGASCSFRGRSTRRLAGWGFASGASASRTAMDRDPDRINHIRLSIVFFCRATDPPSCRVRSRPVSYSSGRSRLLHPPHIATSPTDLQVSLPLPPARPIFLHRPAILDPHPFASHLCLLDRLFIRALLLIAWRRSSPQPRRRALCASAPRQPSPSSPSSTARTQYRSSDCAMPLASLQRRV
jgi:hypothetical protein